MGETERPRQDGDFGNDQVATCVGLALHVPIRHAAIPLWQSSRLSKYVGSFTLHGAPLAILGGKRIPVYCPIMVPPNNSEFKSRTLRTT